MGGVERRGWDGELGGREEGEGGGYCVDEGGEEKRGYFCCRGRVLVGLGEIFWMSQSDARLQGGKGNETDLGECIFGLYFVVVVVLESPELDQKPK